MSKQKDWITIFLFLAGILIIAITLVSPYIEKLTSQKVIIEVPSWFVMLGAIFIMSSITFKIEVFNRYRHLNLIKYFFITALLSSIIFTVGYTYGQYDKVLHIKSQNINVLNDQVNLIGKMETMSKDCSLNNKKVIIRDDDIGACNSNKSLEWLSNLTYEKGTKVTYAVVPFYVSENIPLTNYLKNLNKDNFEIAVHGYKHEDLYGKPYGEQFGLIKNSTDIMEKHLKYKPYTFVPPYNRGDINTTKACRILGYHTITDVRGYPLYLKDINRSFDWETEYNPPKQHSFEEFKNAFDSYYNSSSEFFVLCMHDWSFIGENNSLDREKTENFQKAINYMISKNVQFMTIEEAYRWSVDENSIAYGLINESSYFVDLRECKYNHTIKISQIPENISNITISNINTQKAVKYNQKGIKNIEFEVQSGYLYYIQYQI